MLAVDLPTLDLTQVDFAPDSVELRKIKISASNIFQGLATACVCIAKVAEAKTSKEKKETTCAIVSSALLLASDACEKHEQHKQKKQEQQTQTNKTEKTKTDSKEDSETKSINFAYLQQIQDLSTDQERMELVNNILQNREETEILLDEVNSATKLLLIDALFE